MAATLTPIVLVSLALLPACAKPHDAAPSGLAFELAFEGSCEPGVATDLAREVPTSGITFGQGVEGRAARFDGTGAELKFLGIDALNIEDAMTLEFFVSPDDWLNPYGAGSGLESIVSHSDIFTVGVDPRSWELQARLTTSTSEKSQRLEGGSMKPGAWHHVALVLDGAKHEARLVLDGEVVCEVPAQGKVPVRHDLHLVVGTWYQKNQAFCGALDSIRLWNRALSADELRARAALALHSAASTSQAPGS